MPVPKVRDYFQSQENPNGFAPFADPLFDLGRKQDSKRLELAEIEKQSFKFCTIEPDQESESGYCVRISDEKKFNELQSRKQRLIKGIAKIDEIFDAVDGLLKDHREAEYPVVRYVQSRADYWRGRAQDKKFQFTRLQIAIPEKVMDQVKELEARANAFDKLAADVATLAAQG